jgi:hypothetical protein
MVRRGSPRVSDWPSRATGARVARVGSESADESTRDGLRDVGAVSASDGLMGLPTVVALQSRALVGRTCTFELPDGRPCRATPMRDEPYCFWHSPDHAEEAAEARRLGGLRRRREKTITTVYELDGLGTVDGIRRLLDIAVADALGLENSIARARILIAAAMAATRLLEVGEVDTRQAFLAAGIAVFTGEDEETRAT